VSCRPTLWNESLFQTEKKRRKRKKRRRRRNKRRDKRLKLFLLIIAPPQSISYNNCDGFVLFIIL
jgi:polyferredoxin